jgi:hypothetical protein
MNLVGHIVRKDLHRLAGPLGLWLVLVLAHALLVMAWSPAGAVVAAAYEGQRYFTDTCGVMVMGIGFVLAAWLVMEDSLVSTQAFWRTRAISGFRLLAAKVLGALLMFSVLPVVVLTPVWLWCGFGGREVLLAAGEFALAQAMCSLGAFALGGITHTSGQFLVRLLGGAIILPLYLAYVLGAFSRAGSPDGLRSVLLTAVIVVIPLAMTLYQFLTRRTAVTWMILLLGLGLMLPVSRWPADKLPAWLLPTPPDGVAATRPVFTAQQLSTAPLNSLDKGVPLQMNGRVEGAEPGTRVRVDQVQAWWLGTGVSKPGPRLRGLVTNGRPSEAAVRGLAGVSGVREDGSLMEWSAANRETAGILAEARAAGLKLGGVVRATVLRGRRLGELPLRAGGVLRSGSSLTRIVDVKSTDSGLVVQLEERDAWLTADAGTFSASYDPVRRRIRPAEDGFVVLNRAHGVELVPAMEEVGTILGNSVVTGRRNLVITAPAEDAGWLENAILVKVRFAPSGKISQPLSGEPLALPR